VLHGCGVETIELNFAIFSEVDLSGKGGIRRFCLLEDSMTKKDVFRVVTRAEDGSLKIRDFHSAELIFRTHTQIGIDDSSTDLDLRGMPVFRGLIGPIPEGKNIVRYETPEVFELLTKEWATNKPRRRRRSTKAVSEAAPVVQNEWVSPNQSVANS